MICKDKDLEDSMPACSHPEIYTERERGSSSFQELRKNVSNLSHNLFKLYTIEWDALSLLQYIQLEKRDEREREEANDMLTTAAASRRLIK